MTFTPCRYAERWPELWALLPSDDARRSLSSTLANGRLEGMEPTREMVVDLVARARGEMTIEEFFVRARARAASVRTTRS